MCTQYLQAANSTIHFKDFLPFLGMIITIFLGYYGISIQIRKNRKERWVDEFRKVVSEFISILEINAPELHTKMEEIIKCNNHMGLYLDPLNPTHQELAIASQDYLEYVLKFPNNKKTTEPLNWEQVRLLLNAVKTKANKVLITELEKNNSIFIRK